SLWPLPPCASSLALPSAPRSSSAPAVPASLWPLPPCASSLALPSAPCLFDGAGEVDASEEDALQAHEHHERDHHRDERRRQHERDVGVVDPEELGETDRQRELV